MQILTIVGAGLIVIGAGLGIGKMVVQQWTLLHRQPEASGKPNSYAYCCCVN
jgi:F-type H+-transporting ATPase subunit c